MDTRACQRNIKVEAGTEGPMSHPDNNQMIQDLHYPAQALPAQPTSPNPSGLKGSTMPLRLTRWENVAPDPSKLPRPLVPVMTAAADPAALIPIGRQPQAAIRLRLPPRSGPTSRRLTLDVHMPTAHDPGATSQAMLHINHTLRPAV